MNSKKFLKKGVVIILGVCLLALLAGQALGHPILLSYVETGSMEPTLNPGDGFIAVPSEVAGPITEGDVVVFEAQSVGGGGITTHRVVSRTDQGYLTKGDANNAVDQRSGEPAVTEATIVAKALQVGGEVVVIPHLGTFVQGTETIAGTLLFRVNSATSLNLGISSVSYILFAVSIFLYLRGASENETRDRSRNRSRDSGVDVRVVIAGFAILLMLGATAAMVIPGGTQEFTLISSQAETSAVVQAGDTTTQTYQLTNPGLVPSVSFLKPVNSGITVERHEVRLQPGEQSEVTVTLQAPEETGFYRYYLTEYRYMNVLPADILFKLYQIHPWIPILIIDGCLGIPFYLLGSVLLDNSRIRTRSRERPRSLIYRVMERFQ